MKTIHINILFANPLLLKYISKCLLMQFIIYNQSDCLCRFLSVGTLKVLSLWSSNRQ